jgi:X-Pro dipeptidyl-peptidase
VQKFKTAVLISHGLNDLNTKPRMYARLYSRLKQLHVPAKIWLNQGGHGDGANSGARQAAWRDELNRFWSQYLFGVANHWEDGPRSAVQRENSQWVDYADWPAPGAMQTGFLLYASGDNSVGRLIVRNEPKFAPIGQPPPPVPRDTIERIVDDSSIDANALIAAPQSPHRLVYKTEPLTRALHMSGIPAVWLHLSFDQPSAVVSAAVVEYRADGSARLVTRGWADPQNRVSISRTHEIFAGKAYSMEFELQPHDYEFAVGSRIGFVLMSTDRLFTLRPPPGAALSIQTWNAKLSLPIVGGLEAVEASIQ